MWRPEQEDALGIDPLREALQHLIWCDADAPRVGRVHDEVVRARKESVRSHVQAHFHRACHELLEIRDQRRRLELGADDAVFDLRLARARALKAAEEAVLPGDRLRIQGSEPWRAVDKLFDSQACEQT